jgi:alpha-L-fucosidase 2
VIEAPTTNLVVGATLQLTATALDGKGNAVPGETYVWSSSNTDKASVSANGVVTGKKQGRVTITAHNSRSGKSGSVNLEVKKK